MDKEKFNNIIEKSRMKIAISNFEEEDIKMPKVDVFKVVATFVLAAVVTTGIVYASTIIYDKIWKEPKKYTYEEMINNLPPEKISEEEKQEEKLITEEEAKQKAIEILEILGYGKQKINRIELKRGYSGEKENESYYMVKTKYGYEEGLMILIDSKTGKFTFFEDMELKYRNLKEDRVTDDRMKEVALDVYSKLGLKENEYELVEYNKITESYFQNKKKNLMGFRFSKKYNGIYNRFQSVSGSYIVSDGKVIYNTVSISDTNCYENNPIEISKEKAIEIASNKERELSSKEITIEDAELSIEMMNAKIYQLENNIDLIVSDENRDDAVYLKTDKIIRNVWKVKISHKERDKVTPNIQDSIKEQTKYIKENIGKTYYVDTTTGEIIGGEIGIR